MMPPGAVGDKPDRYLLGITRSYRSVFIPEDGYTLHLPAPFKTVHEYAYRPDGRLDPIPRTQ